tara:strand:- start:15246 stop:15488 length:243 start_codon:yes stop_codon:yes gene_type:complete
LGNGCDCCEPTQWFSYTSPDIEKGLGVAHQEDECYVYAIISVMGQDNITQTIEEELFQMELDRLIKIANNLDIIVEIIED